MQADMHLTYLAAAAAVVFTTGLTGGWLGLRGGREGAGEGLLQGMGAPAAAGIFLGAGFIHMLGDASDTFGAALPSVEFPLAFLLAAVGFVIVLAIERVVFRAAAAAHGLNAYILTVILGFHSLIAGIALGVEDTALVGLAIAIAIVAHKGAAAFALASSFVKAGMARGRARGLVITFSCVTPTGIAIGALIGNLLDGNTGEIVEATFDSLAAGSFFYVAAIDIINEEFAPGEHKHHRRLLALVAGLGLMALIAVWA